MDIYIADVSCLNSTDLFTEKLHELPVRRREKIISAAAKNSRTLSAGAGLLLNHALKKYGIDGKTAEYSVNPYGKPYLNGQNIFFNISHSGKYVICATAGEEIGIDIQKSVRCAANTANRFFHPDEQLYIKSLPAADRPAAFLRLWTLKESYIKALGKGIANMLRSFSVKFEGKTAYVCSGGRQAPYFFAQYTVDGYFAAVCSGSRPGSVPLQWVDLSR